MQNPRVTKQGGRGTSNRVKVIKLVPKTRWVPDILPAPQGDTFHEKRENALIKQFIIYFPAAITCSPITLMKVQLPTVLSTELVNQPTPSGVSVLRLAVGLHLYQGCTFTCYRNWMYPYTAGALFYLKNYRLSLTAACTARRGYVSTIYVSTEVTADKCQIK
jgi:hypothetical protein